MAISDVLCFSHLRWSFVFQRPNHLMLRCARQQRVFFIEEPLFDAQSAHLEIQQVFPRLLRVTPHLPPDPRSLEQTEREVSVLLSGLCRQHEVTAPIHWYYTPMMLGVSAELPCGAVVYDCMDQLANFLHAPAELVSRERQLLDRADIVFTGGRSLYEAKRKLHPNVYALPSSVDAEHFGRAREGLAEPPDQASIPHPRIGYCGVIDERIDLQLIEQVAQKRPDWQIMMIGPVAKIPVGALPHHDNIHYLGLRTYDDLPAYLSGWDAAIMPFARNAATRFISPTKTLEYLAAGRAVVSTPIRDVVEPYGRLGLVRIAQDGDQFVRELEQALRGTSAEFDARRDDFLASTSWDTTWARMQQLLIKALTARLAERSVNPVASRPQV
jgi:hypothetical protein